MKKTTKSLTVISALLLGFLSEAVGLEIVDGALECERMLGNVQSKNKVYVLMIKEDANKDAYVSMCVDTIGGESRWPTYCLDVVTTDEDIVRSNEWFFLKRDTLKLTMGDSMYQCEVANSPSDVLRKITDLKGEELLSDEP